MQNVTGQVLSDMIKFTRSSGLSNNYGVLWQPKQLFQDEHFNTLLNMLKAADSERIKYDPHEKHLPFKILLTSQPDKPGC